jgi:hypothetical protein
MKTKLLGAFYNKARRNWKSQINFKGHLFQLGYFKTEEQAHKAYTKAKAYLESLQPGDLHYEFFLQLKT